jgi:hypothetical protein
MLFALIGYSSLTLKSKLNGAKFILVGILLSILAGAVQAGESIEFHLIWAFDHNGTFHLIQMVALVFLLIGIKTSLSKMDIT